MKDGIYTDCGFRLWLPCDGRFWFTTYSLLAFEGYDLEDLLLRAQSGLSGDEWKATAGFIG
jgi:hypothetical protein